ncbi:hypothetical protein KP509_24G072800 [Ceratopteris richardii]|uniref:Uncharacterized protein n=1 Tax=Ceratopteris richardii TaxID=49495 RepID=A0A8T2RW91_CERRI|nr:hypothetical protein KP509_24G072800 [Ceratopteris richardii]
MVPSFTRILHGRSHGLCALVCKMRYYCSYYLCSHIMFMKLYVDSFELMAMESADMQQLRSFALPLPPADVHDYGHLEDHLFRGINPRLLTFSILALAPLSGFLRPPTPIKISPSLPSAVVSSFASPSSRSLQIFFFFNTLALVSCIAGLVLSIIHFFSAYQNPNNRYSTLVLQRRRLAQGLSKTAGGIACLMIGCVSLAAAYPFAGLTVAGESKSLQYAVMGPSIIGGLLLFKPLWFLVRHFFEWWASFMPDHQLWRAIQQHTVFGSFLARCLEI